MTSLRCDALLFDMDGTLIDDSESYREAIRLTAEFLLRHSVSEEHVREIKRIPGFNNEWDTTWALVRWQRGGTIRVPTQTDRSSAEYARLQTIFQTYYLGDRVWRERSGQEPPFRWDEPLILRETPLVTRSTLESLLFLPLGIATSRPHAEAAMAIRQHELERFFPDRYVVGLEDAPHEKPHPAPLLELASRLGCRSPVYVGDTVNDAIAALDAGMPFIHIGREPLSDPAIERRVTRRLASVNDMVDLVASSASSSPESTADV